MAESRILHDLLAIVKGFRNGIVYGVKIRLPHAFVMTFLFNNGTYNIPFNLLRPVCVAWRRNSDGSLGQQSPMPGIWAVSWPSTRLLA